MSESGSGSTGFPLLNDVLAAHLTGCEQCQAALRRPVGLGQRSRHCDEYREIIRRYAEYEGVVNNVVAHDEYGNQAGDSSYWENRRGME